MVERFLRKDWLYVRSCADRIAVQLRAKGIEFEGFVGLPPVPAQQYRDFKAATGKALPNDFLELTRGFSGGWSFPWHLKVGEDWIKPPVAPSLIGSAETFIGLTVQTPLLEVYHQFQVLLKNCCDDDEPYEEENQFVLPLDSSASGDYLALRFDRDPPLVVLLNHEAGYNVARARTICHGFKEFIFRWAAIGFPDFEDAAKWVDDATGMLVHDDQRAKNWLAWIADPEAKLGNA